MAISGNQSTEQGDVFVIKADSPIVGLVALTSFIDTTTGTFYKEFRYSTDGINFSPWAELTDPNLAAVNVEPKGTFLIEYRYTNLVDAVATFDEVQVSGSFTPVTDGKVYSSSIFGEFFNSTDTEVVQWCVNVTDKLYQNGIVPKFIERGDESNINGVDRDYIDFWRTVACFFAYIVKFARLFKTFRTVDILLDEFLKERGIYFCDANSNAEKNYLVENYFDEIRQRGTSKIYKTKTENNSTVDGELLRTICYEPNDEFIFNLHLPHTIGWSVGNSSPLFTSCENQLGVNKSYENTKDFVDLNSYPIISGGTQAIITDGSKEVFSILNVPTSSEGGIGQSDVNFAINVDNSLDYEITFFVRQPVAQANLTFEVLSYDTAGTSTVLQRVTDSVDQNFFFERIQLANTSDYFFVRGIIYNKDRNAGQNGTGTISSSGTSVTGVGTLFSSELSIGDLIEVNSQKIKVVDIGSDTTLTLESSFETNLSGESFVYYDSNSVDSSSFNGGVNLKMKSDTGKIIPKITLDSIVSATNEIRLWDVKIRPLSTTYSTGFVNPKNFISMWLNHKNPLISRQELESRLTRKLLPYDTTYRINYLNTDFEITS